VAQPGWIGGEIVAWAQATARTLLADLDNRLSHVEAVGRRAEWVGQHVCDEDRVPLLAAAYLHDIGYAAQLRVTGLHPLDGARWLRAQGVDERVCNLVAYHSGARFEAEERGLVDDLEAFDPEEGPAMDALIFADMTTARDGSYVSFQVRLTDILIRYPPSDPVHRAMVRAGPVLRGSIDRTLERLAAAGQPMYGSAALQGSAGFAAILMGAPLAR